MFNKVFRYLNCFSWIDYPWSFKIPLLKMMREAGTLCDQILLQLSRQKPTAELISFKITFWYPKGIISLRKYEVRFRLGGLTCWEFQTSLIFRKVATMYTCYDDPIRNRNVSRYPQQDQKKIRTLNAFVFPEEYKREIAYVPGRRSFTSHLLKSISWALLMLFKNPIFLICKSTHL